MLAAAIAKLKGVAPYLIMALVLPGGLLVTPLLWFYRRTTPEGHGNHRMRRTD